MSGANETSEQLKVNILSRLKKIQGQMKGIAGMIESGKECEDILTQVKAVRAALKSMNTLIVRRYLLTCNQELETKEGEERQQQLDKMVTVISRFLD